MAPARSVAVPERILVSNVFCWKGMPSSRTSSLHHCDLARMPSQEPLYRISFKKLASLILLLL